MSALCQKRTLLRWKWPLEPRRPIELANICAGPPRAAIMTGLPDCRSDGRSASSLARVAERFYVRPSSGDRRVRYSQTQGEHNETICHLSGDCIGSSIPFVARSKGSRCASTLQDVARRPWICLGHAEQPHNKDYPKGANTLC